MKTILAPWIKLTEYLDREDYNRISTLQEQCVKAEKISLKLELDYKLAVASESSEKTGKLAVTNENSEKSGIKEVNEFLYFDGQQLVGYIGICSFGGQGTPLEVTGMVHPEYRRQGIFSILNEYVLAECRRRNSNDILLLCDKKSASGQSFLKKIQAVYKNSEFEMYLQQDFPNPDEQKYCSVILIKAVNADAYEIARQNEIYFGDINLLIEPNSEECDSITNSEDSIHKEDILLPEDEEKCGMTIYLAKIGEQIVGKVNLDTNTAVGGIYGLGVLPEYRGKGLGRAVLLRAIEKLKEKADIKNIMLQVAAQNETALNLYKSCGFVETSTMDYFMLKL